MLKILAEFHENRLNVLENLKRKSFKKIIANDTKIF